ncbi:DHH family phosphoesterase [Clostridium aestuarii]|uniref:Cyclic-di-AMP phosphodiesterase n=1 Tax=Clostridium aestuarii TaxID=338193 RepID=A0ABT4D571_9CLOT|nr:DHH family phosphoesterase [Clostridium aestuarii]MCY6485350.1 DHH family phosphoesterase [Clostridium aestuarii]
MDNYFIQNNKLYIVIIAVLISIIFIFGHFYVGGIALVVYGVIIVYNVKIFKKKKDEWEKIIEKFEANMNISTRNILVNTPVPLTIVGSKGNILWYNEKFIDIFSKKDILGKDIKEIAEKINIDEILNYNIKVLKFIRIDKKYYSVFINSEFSTNKNKIMFLYFYDVTEEMRLRTENEENKDAVILIEVDNLNDVLKTTEEDKAVILSAEIERTIKNYAQNLHGMIVKYSNSKYIVVVHNKIIKSEMDKKFDILDEIREINFGNKLTVTLSVGVGVGGETPLQNNEFATSAKDLALSRGGDQVVIKNKEKLQFYGGKTKEIAKRTKVRARVVAHALANIINESSKVYIMGHINPDIDSIGAAIGISSVVKALGKESYIILDSINNGIENAIKKMKKEGLYDEIFISKQECINYYDKDSLLILLDVNSRSYVQNIEIVDEINRIVIIDHHRKSTDAVEGSLLDYIEAYASSTCELVTEMLQYMLESPKKSITPIVAEMLLAGIYVDTKNFYFKTGVRTFEAAAYLRQMGADIIDVKKMFASDLETYLKKAKIISLAEVEKNISIAVCPPEIDDTVLAAQVSDELLNITGVQASFVLVKIKDEISISGRSFGDINVQLILEELGGGGHMTIAGTKLSNVSIYAAKEKLQQAIDKYLKEGEE